MAVKTYEEIVEYIAMKTFDNAMSGGQGRIDVGDAPFIYGVDADKMYDDVKAKEVQITKEYFSDRNT